MVRADGETRWLSLHIHPYRAEPGAGGEARLVATVIDFSGRKAKEEEAQNNRARLRAVLSIALSAIISINAKHRIALFNEAAERLFGYTPAEIIGQPLDVLVPVRFRRTHRGHVDGFWTGPQYSRRMGERQDVAGLRKDGSEFPAEASISKTEIGGERIFTVVLHDITERKHAAEQLSNMNGTLEQRVGERTSALEEAMRKREEAHSETGKGTTVHLYLPRAEAKVGGAAATATRGSAILFSRNNETVLVVEDNSDVRETTLQRVEGLVARFIQFE